MANPGKIREVFSDGIARLVATPASQPGDVFPSGVILQFAGAAAPTNWMICDGTAISRTTYAALFTAIGTTYGSGDGSTTFNLPDLRDKVPVGKSGTKALGSTGGAATVTLSVANLANHGHNPGSLGVTAAPDHAHFNNVDHVSVLGGGGALAGTFAAGAAAASHGTTTDVAGGHGHTVTGVTEFTGGGTAHENMPPYLALNHIIKT